MSAVSENSNPGRTGTDDTNLDAIVTDAMNHWGVPGLVIGILNGADTNVQPYGTTSAETQFSVRADTLFQIGSITKPFTATLLMKLAQDKIIDLDKPVVNYVPDLTLADETARQEITTRHLLTHTAGFWGDWFADFGLADDAIEEFVGHYGDLHQLTAPGEHWAYNNCGYILAGLVAARSTDMTFEDALSTYILEPLNLKQTKLSAADAISFPVAVGHTWSNDTSTASATRSFLRPRCRNPAGGILASAADVLEFARFHISDKPEILTRGTLTEMHTPAVLTYESGVAWGLGFALENRDGIRIVGHGGATNGFRASLAIVPEMDFALTILTNSDRGNQAIDTITDQILQHYCNIEPVEFPSVVLPASDAERYVGRYHQPYAELDIRRVDSNLETRLTSHSPYSEQDQEIIGEWAGLRAISSTEFIVNEGEMQGSHVKIWLTGNLEVRFVQAGGRLYEPAP